MESPEEVIESYESDDTATNPFTQTLTLQAYWKTDKTSLTTSDNFMVSDGVAISRGGKQSGATLSIGYPIDVVRSTRLFHGNEDHENRILKLKPGALRLFLLLTFKVSVDSDRVRIFSGKYAKRTGITSLTTFYSAIQDLIDAGVIVKYKSNIYWINPSVIFNGNRLEKYPDKVKIINES